MNNIFFPTSINFSRATRSAAALCVVLAFAQVGGAQQSGTTGERSDRSPPTSTTRINPAGALNAKAKEFLHKAAVSGLREVRLSELALERGSHPEVRSLAQTLLEHHQRANAQLATLANSRGVIIPLDTASASMRMSDEPSATDPVVATTSPSADPTAHDSTPASGAPAGQASSSRTRADTRGSAATAHTDKLIEEVQAAVAKLSRETGASFDRAYVDQMVRDHEKSVDLFEDEADRKSDVELTRFVREMLPTLREHLNQARTLRKALKG